MSGLQHTPAPLHGESNPTTNDSEQRAEKSSVGTRPCHHSDDTLQMASLAITGSGGMGAVTVGTILLEALCAEGQYGVMTRSYGPQIRGGESAVILRFGNHPVQSLGDYLDALFCLDWLNVDRFADELPLSEKTTVLGCSKTTPPPCIVDSPATIHTLDIDAELATIEHGRQNMLATGILAAWMGLPAETLAKVVSRSLASKGQALIDSSLACVTRGYTLSPDCLRGRVIERQSKKSPVWNISGNEACAYGALLGGVRFVAAYPITPATELLEWLAPRLPQVGGALVQAEDELASINMIIGGSFGGVPSLTATSGPGLALMLESVGLAVASEIPIVIVNVSRGGPSTGIPTKPEQSDLNIALYGMHGDAPHLVVAPTGVDDCLYTTQKLVEYAELLQVPAILLSDQQLAQARVIMDVPVCGPSPVMRLLAGESDQPYKRYAASGSGVSPMSIPGVPDLQYTADGLEHSETGTPSSRAADHALQTHKRRHKLTSHDFGDYWGWAEGSGSVALISWGSSCDATREAAAMLRHQGLEVVCIGLRQLLPLPADKLKSVLQGLQAAMVVELNDSGQLFHYLHSESVLPAKAVSFCRQGPLTFKPGEIVRAAEKLLFPEHEAAHSAGAA